MYCDFVCFICYQRYRCLIPTTYFRRRLKPDARSKVWVWGRSFAGIVGSNPARAMNVCYLSVVFCQVSASGRSLVQRIPTEYDVSEYDREDALAHWGLLRHK